MRSLRTGRSGSKCCRHERAVRRHARAGCGYERVRAAGISAVARSVPALAGALFVVGVANSTMDLSMNAQGVSVERYMRRPILSSLHAAFSFGGFAGLAWARSRPRSMLRRSLSSWGVRCCSGPGT